MDLVDRLLANMEVGVGAFSLCDVRSGYQLTFKASQATSLHYCLAGHGQIRLRDGLVIELRRDSFVLVPAKVSYSIGSDDQEGRNLLHRLVKAPSFLESVPRIQAGEGELGIESACGEIGVQDNAMPDLFAFLDRPLVEHFNAEDGLRDHFITLLAELARPGIGTRALTEALLKQCLILLLRRMIAQGEPAIPWMTALIDPGLARALQAMLENFSERFSVESLARLAGMSRSAFAARFTQALSQTPMDLLKTVRLRRARELLVTSTMSVAEIARNVGFPGRSNFSRAFHAKYGVDPRSFRTRSFIDPADAE